MAIDRLCALAVTMLLCVPAQAQGTVGELKEILSRTQLLVATKALREAERALEGIGPSATVRTADQSNNTAAETPAVVPYPTVRGVYGSAGVRWATLSYATGDIRDAKAGDVVHPKCRLHEVNVSRVTMKCADDVIDLTFSEFAPAQVVAKPAPAPQQPSMPGIGPGPFAGQVNPPRAY